MSLSLCLYVPWNPPFRLIPWLCGAEWQLYPTNPPPTPCSPWSLCRLCSLKGWTTEGDSRPQSGWARSTTMACLPACLHIVHTSVGEGNLPFSDFFCTCCQTLRPEVAWVSINQELIKESDTWERHRSPIVSFSVGLQWETRVVQLYHSKIAANTQVEIAGLIWI